MTRDSTPADVQLLLDERTAAREERDWARADALRDEIASLGWEVQDGPRGSTVRPLLPEVPAGTDYASPEDLASLLDEPATVDASVQVVAEDHPDDLRRLLSGLAAHPPSMSWELVIVANAPSFDLEPIASLVAGIQPTLLRTSERLGWGDSRTLGMRRSRGEVTVLLDTSVEPTGDFLAPLLAAFEDPTVGLAGGWGVKSGDGRQFEEAPAGEVDAVEGYCLAVRREALRTVGGFDRRFRFYRNADLDFSFAIRDAGWRAIRTETLPVTRHEHRGYAALPEAERDRLSKRNFYRFLEHWGDRRDLLLERSDR
ncbi:MAG TPA: glycosyltransferase [Candidatus Limnocylindrales bacterium]|nr:glycosyltransferase [Candidatus Limnocylindrales bacterium]